MEPGVYYLHDTYIEILRPIKAVPKIEYDSVGNVKDLTQTEDGSHPYLLSTMYTDHCAASNIKNHPDCYHLELKSGQTSHILYYDTAASLSAEPLPIPYKSSYVDWVALGDIDNNGVLAEKLFFSKDSLFAFITKYIKAQDEMQVEEAVLSEYKDGDIFRMVGIEREPTALYTEE